MKTVKKKKVAKKRSLCNTSGILQRISDAMLSDGLSTAEPMSLADCTTLKDVLQYDSYNQGQVIFKKLPPANQEPGNGLTTEQLKMEAYKKFYATIDRLSALDLSFLDSIGRFVPFSNKGDKLCQRARSISHALVGPGLDLHELFLNCKHSGGMTLGNSFGNTTETCKWSDITGTEDTIRLFQIYLHWDRDLLRHLYDVNGGLEIYNLLIEMRSPFSEIVQFFLDDYVLKVESSRATTVPKNTKTDRLIAIEPTLNMFFQQGVMVWLYERIKIVFQVDLTNQQAKNGYLAYLGSLFPSLWATIDFESASDSVLLTLVRFLFPHEFTNLLTTIRCKSMDIDGCKVDLQMISTMGNATTFPIESIVFYSFMIACISMEKDTSNSSLVDLSEYKDAVGIFGDDCILPQKFVSDFIDICTQVGFVVNKEKSYFGSECFRESCGQDYLLGCNVRAVYISSQPPVRKSDLESWLYKYYNSILNKCISHFVEDWYERSSGIRGCFFSLFQKYNISPCVVPEDYPIDAGLFRSLIRLDDPALLTTQPLLPFFDPSQGGYSFSFKRFIYRDENDIHESLVYRRFLWGIKEKSTSFSLYSNVMGNRFFSVDIERVQKPTYLSSYDMKVKGRDLALWFLENQDILSEASITLKKKDMEILPGFTNYLNGMLRRQNLRQKEEAGNDLFESRKRIGGYVVAKGLSYSYAP